jgi:2,3-dihydroxybenzoate-AMP ligase
VDLDAIVTFLRAQDVAAYKLPQRLVVCDQLPKTSTGKIRKQELVLELAG